MTVLRWTVLATQVPPGGSLGGVVRYTTELIRALAERDDVLVSAITTRAAADTLGDLVGAAGEVHVLPDLPVPLLSAVERYWPSAALRREPDVLHGVKHLLPAGGSALRVLTVHDMLLLDRPQDFGRAKRMILPAPYRASIDDADLLLCVSAATRDRLVAHAPGAAERAEVVHLATSSSLRASEPTPIPALAGRRFALAVGDPNPRRNLRTVLAAWSALQARLPDVALAVAGPPSWGRTVLGQAFGRLAEAGAVVPVGQVSDAELRWAYEHADLVVCPSLAEGFGLPAVEAMTFGAPVVVSDDPALVEVTAGRALATVPALDVDAWVRVVGDVLADCGDRTTDEPPIAPTGLAHRTWADVAEETVQSVRKLRAAGGTGVHPASGSRTPFWTMSRSR